MFCTNCGNEMPYGAEVCPTCGNRVESKEINFQMLPIMQVSR